MRTDARGRLGSASALAGFGALASFLCRPLYSHAVGSYDQPPSQALLAFLLILSLVLGVAAIAAGLLSVARRSGGRWKGVAGAVLGLVPLALTAGAWIAALPPRVSLADLHEFRDRAVPVIEKVTGLGFKSPVAVELGRSGAVRSKLEEGVRRRSGQSEFTLPYDLAGLYDQEAKVAYVMPDGIGKLQRERVLADAPAQDIARAVLVDELVHALDDQNGMFESSAELAAMMTAEQNRFWIRRAIQEGRSSFFGRKACAELGVRCFDSFMAGRPGRREKPDWFQEMFLERIAFVYGAGPRFMDWLDKAGRADLISKASSEAPLWQHYIRRPDVYASDVDSGMDARFRDAFSHVPEVFPTSEWRRMSNESWGLVDVPRAYESSLGDSPSRERFNSLAIAGWLGSFRAEPGARRVSVWLWRFLNGEAAEEGFALRRTIWREDAAPRGKTLETAPHECPGVQSCVFVTKTNDRGDEKGGADLRCLARSGRFLLAVKLRSWPTEKEAATTGERLLRGLLVPLGR